MQPGLTELELAAEVEYSLRLLGHQGLVRLRNLDLEMFFGHVLSGVSGLHLAYTDTPSGGWGFSPAFPQGAGLKRLAPHEPISIDIASCVNGYVADMTRMFAIQEMPARAWEAYELVQDIYRIFESQVRAGVRTKDIYHTIWDEVKRRGRQEYFMGQGPDRVRFLGHGVGLELDEFPLLSARFPYPLEAGMVMTFEPKFFLPEVGMVGQEDTCLITADGVEWLTQAPRRVLVV